MFDPMSCICAMIAFGAMAAILYIAIKGPMVGHALPMEPDEEKTWLMETCGLNEKEADEIVVIPWPR